MAMQALVLGFGGTGAHILTALKELTVLKHGRVPETIKFLLFDTIADWEPGKAVQIIGGAAEEKTAKSEDESASLDRFKEYFQLTDFQPDLKTHVYNYLSQAGNPDQYPHLKDWLHAPWLSENIPQNQLNITIGAAQQRQIGRFAMFKNADRIIAFLQPIIRELGTYAKGSDINVWIIGSSAGGTGAGCLIDAAYLIRLAAREINLKLTGVIVLPNVYSGVRGINEGRAYSLLRELERVQEQGIPQDDRYVHLDRRELVSSKVIYDKTGQLTAIVRSKLFDDLFYLGKDSPTDDLRKDFFISVASGIDPYLDDKCGPALLEKAVNDNAAASAFGSARIYVPLETLIEIFTWEQVAEYIEKAMAPKKLNDQVTGLNFGSGQDRSDNAKSKIKGLLKLFEVLLDQDAKTKEARDAFVRNELDAKQIVTIWYELTGSNRTPEEQTVLLTYVNPFYSFTQSDPPQNIKDWETKSFKENEQAKGVKEKQEESKLRFADKLEEVKKRYVNSASGERTFEKGRRQVLDIISKRLKMKIDNLFIEGLARNRSEFAVNPTDPDQGTALTRLYAEVSRMLEDRGPLRKIHEIIGQFVDAVAREENDRNNRYIKALQDLRDCQKSGFFSFGTWVEDYQQTARQECIDYIRWYQKYELLKDMQKLILNVEQRLKEWERLFAKVFYDLVIQEGSTESESSVLFTVKQIYLKNKLEERLIRAARNSTAVISLSTWDQEKMHGYREELRSRATDGLLTNLLTNSHWEASLTSEGVPSISLIIEAPDLTKRNSFLRNLHQELYEFFHHRVGEKLRNTDIFDYLLWIQDRDNLGPEKVADFLNSKSTPLIDSGGTVETRTLVYCDPVGTNKKNLVDAIAGKLQSPVFNERAYSDPNAITLVKVKKPSLGDIVDIQTCRRIYNQWRAEKMNNNETHDKELLRAQVFHPFRQELEAWYIERFCQRKENNVTVPDLPPRIVRLLEDPEMIQLFTHCIATGAVERQPSSGWVWHGLNENIQLTSDEDEPDADLVKAAIIFALRQGEGQKGGLRRISREEAKRSVVESAQRQKRTPDEMITEFINQKLKTFLAENAPENLRKPLEMVFTFYCDLKTRSGIQHRMKLP